MRRSRDQFGRSVLATALVMCVVAAGTTVFDAPAANAAPPGGMSAAQMNAMFGTYGDAGGHWTGGDGSVSLLLPDGRVAWLFSDTFLGVVNPDGSRPANTPMVNNTLVVQDGTNLVSTLHGGPASSPMALVAPESPGEFFWVADGVVEGGQLKVLYNRYTRMGAGPFDTELVGTSLATFTLPDLALSSVTDLPVGRRIIWGAALLVDGSYSYVYGTSSGLGNLKFGHVARAPVGSLGGAWEYWTGTAWSTDLASAARLISGVGTGFAVEKMGSQYVLVTQENNLVFDAQIVAYTASSPTGPFTGPIQLFTAPEPQPGAEKIVYFARLHQELARAGKLLVSYDVNSLDNQATYDDARLYRPRFVEVDWPLPAPGPLPAAPGGFTVTTDLSGRAHLTWNAVSGATGYRVHRRDVTGGQTHFVRHGGVTDTSMQAGSLIPGHEYEFKVTTTNANGEGAFSPARTVTPRVDASAASVVRFANSPESVPGQYIVRLRDTPALRAAGVASFAAELATQVGGTLRRVYPRTLRGFSVGLTESRAIDLAGHPDVLDVEQNQTVTIDGVQIDPPSWGLDRIDQESLPRDQMYHYPNLGSGVYVYVLDSGIRTTHVDFGGRASYGWNSFDQNTIADDCLGHGTHVAGTIGGTEFGVAKGVNLVAVKVLDCNRKSTAEIVADGVEWATTDAVDNNRRPAVLNMSLGAPGFMAGGMDGAVQAAIDVGLTVVASAGNNATLGSNTGDACLQSPARMPAVITVANVDPTDTRYRSSNYGTCVDIFAPGTGIVSADWRNDTDPRTATGTSMAAPHVAGAAALILAAHPEYSASDVSGALLAAATPNVVNDPHGSPNRLLFIEQAPTHAPTNLTAIPNADGTIGLSWDAVPETGVHYLVWQRDATIGETTFTRWDERVDSGTTAVAKDLVEGHTYEFKVAAANSTGVGPESNVASAVAHQAPPAAPTDLTATANADGTITLNWVATGSDLWFNVYQRDASASELEFTKLPLPVTNCCTMTAGLLLHDQEYEYKVTATNQGGESPPSNVARARSAHPVPASPTGLTGTPGDGSATLSWSASPTPNVWYRVYMREAASQVTFTELPHPVTTCCTFTAGLLNNNSAYEFKVSAIGQGGESGTTNVVAVTPQAPVPVKVTGLTATANTDGTITLTWTSPSGPTYWYDIFQRNVTLGEQDFTQLPLPITSCCTMTAALLQHNNVYEYKVRATNGRAGPQSDPVQAPARYTLPTAPTSLRGVSAGDGMIDLTWDAPSSGGGGFFYWVHWREAGGTQPFVKSTVPTSNTTARWGPLVNGRMYEFKISASNPAGEGPTSATIQVMARGGVPQPPTGLSATPGDGQVVLRWTASPTPNVLYSVYQRETPNGSFVRLPIPVSGTTMTAGLLTNGKTYEFKVTAANASGDSAASNVVSARPMPPIPQPPTGLTATAGDGKVTLRWTASPTPPVYYWIEMRSNGGGWKRLQYPYTSCCTFDVLYLANGTTYDFRVLANNLSGDSAPSNVASARPMPPIPKPPTNLTATPGDGKVTLRWTASPTSPVWYWIEMRTSGGTWKRLPHPYTGCCTFAVTYLYNGTTYDFRVRANNIAGDSAPSNVASARPMPPFPQAPYSLGGRWTSSGVVLWWQPSPTPNVLYEVYLRRHSPSGLAWTKLPLPVAGTTVRVDYLTSGQFYDFYVRAVNLSGSSIATNEVTLLVGGPSIHARIDCRTYIIVVQLPGGKIETGWTEVRAQAWGQAEEPGVNIVVFRRVFARGEWWFTHENNLRTSVTGEWSTDNPMHEASIGLRRYDLEVRVEGPRGEDWGSDSDYCYGFGTAP